MNSKSSTLSRFSKTCLFLFQNVRDILGHTVTQTGFHFLFCPFVFCRLSGLSVTGNFIRLVGTTQSILPDEATLTKSVNETEKKSISCL